jgi:hypothetical protein
VPERVEARDLVFGSGRLRWSVRYPPQWSCPKPLSPPGANTSAGPAFHPLQSLQDGI